MKGFIGIWKLGETIKIKKITSRESIDNSVFFIPVEDVDLSESLIHRLLKKFDIKDLSTTITLVEELCNFLNKTIILIKISRTISIPRTGASISPLTNVELNNIIIEEISNHYDFKHVEVMITKDISAFINKTLLSY